MGFSNSMVWQPQLGTLELDFTQHVPQVERAQNKHLNFKSDISLRVKKKRERPLHKID